MEEREGRKFINSLKILFFPRMWYFSKAKVQLPSMCYHFKHIIFVFVLHSDPVDKICDPFLSVMHF